MHRIIEALIMFGGIAVTVTACGDDPSGHVHPPRHFRSVRGVPPRNPGPTRPPFELEAITMICSPSLQPYSGIANKERCQIMCLQKDPCLATVYDRTAAKDNCAKVSPTMYCAPMRDSLLGIQNTHVTLGAEDYPPFIAIPNLMMDDSVANAASISDGHSSSVNVFTNMTDANCRRMCLLHSDCNGFVLSGNPAALTCTLKSFKQALVVGKNAQCTKPDAKAKVPPSPIGTYYMDFSNFYALTSKKELPKPFPKCPAT
ncbi:uncharacterized protein LOC129582565 [Paramacrobiotus metropolitanus]|uniref:uncharacterized protein LOC129582565 n=1 Tax=Paramacrobiotus metropolitanus TaxID=2943436 RepID=UPI002445C58F|nr:uncharacterized protein LOC129582565 [Paramacrobiotus metropolitanus]